MRLKTQREIQLLKEGGKRLRDILSFLVQKVEIGMPTYELDILAREKISQHGGIPSFLYYGKEFGNPFPSAVCVSLNEEVVHGIPKKERIIKEGDIVSLDIGMWYEGLATDTARTTLVGKSSPDVLRLIQSTNESLDAGIATIKDGSSLRDFARAVESVAKKNSLGVVRDLVGHGVGHEVHEPPQIANYVSGASGEKFEAGMVIALEPMFTLGTWKVEVLNDGWTFVTEDGSMSAHFEDTVVVTKDGVEIITR